MADKYKQNDRVFFSITVPAAGTLEGYGKIAGKTGPMWIIELEKPINNYPYTHIQVMDVQIKEPPAEAK
jgi:hypothetical protein